VNGCLVGELVVSGGCLDKLAFVVEHTTLANLENKFSMSNNQSIYFLNTFFIIESDE
jgi:hypothetical protein